jgi:hypothetical protein
MSTWSLDHFIHSLFLGFNLKDLFSLICRKKITKISASWFPKKLGWGQKGEWGCVHAPPLIIPRPRMGTKRGGATYCNYTGSCPYSGVKRCPKSCDQRPVTSRSCGIFGKKAVVSWGGFPDPPPGNQCATKGVKMAHT